MNQKMFKPTLLTVCFFISLAAVAQDSISKVEPPALRSIVEKGYVESLNFLKRTLPDIPQNEFAYTYSSLTVEDKYGSVATYYLDLLSTVKFDMNQVRGVRYGFEYSYDNTIGLRFTISYDMKKGTSFLTGDTESGLIILDSLKRGYCKPCVTSLQKVIQRYNLKDYHVEVQSLGNTGKLEETFVWQLFVSDKEVKADSPLLTGGTAIFISPVTGERADMSKFFRPPVISK